MKQTYIMKEFIHTVLACYLNSKSSVVRLKELTRNSHETLERLCSCIVIVSPLADIRDSLSFRKRFLLLLLLSGASLNSDSDCDVTLQQ